MESHILNNLKNFEVPFLHKYEDMMKGEDMFFEKAGMRPYKLLAYIASTYKNQIMIVTDSWKGLASIALTYESTNTVHSFTRHNFIMKQLSDQPNHVLHDSVDLLTSDNIEANKELILNSAVIFIDHNPHRGTDEYLLYEFLLANHYKGIVISDHIWIHKPLLDNYWYKIEDKYKYDVTHIGSEDGTAIYTFCNDGDALNNICGKLKKPDVSNWTLVTAYFNLAKCPDANGKLSDYETNEYMKNAITTLSLPYHLVIYCDEESMPIIEKIRPAWLASKTVYKIRNFDLYKFYNDNGNGKDIAVDDLTFSEFRNKINKTRIQKKYVLDNLHCASYYLFRMSRYIMLTETIDENPFTSTHFGWIDMSIEKLGYQNVSHISECLLENRDKFSACFHTFIPKWCVDIPTMYYSRNLSGMSSDFFTGNAYYMRTVCKYIIEKFQYYLDRGYGNTDEQLYYPVFLEHPELFEYYIGSSSEIITNYKYVYERPTEPLANVIEESFHNKEYEICITACNLLLKSIALGKCSLKEEDRVKLQYFFTEATMKMIEQEKE